MVSNAAQEEVNNEVREDINIGDCKQIANSFTNDVLWPIAALNFGDHWSCAAARA